MSNKWAEETLGNLMKLDIEAVEVDPARTYDIVGMLNRGRGLFHREPIEGSETRYKTLNRISPNQIVYSRLKAFEGAITVAPADIREVYASQEFPTFTCGPSLLPEYFRLLATTNRFWDTLQNLSTGMGGRRERVKPKDFLTIKIALPSQSEQRRIVDLIHTIDSQIAALAQEIEMAAIAIVAVRDSIIADENWPLASLEELTTKIGSGATPRGGESAYVREGVALIRSQNVYDLAFEWEGLARITDTQAKLLDGVSIESGDVLINITGASVNRVCVVPNSAIPARVNQHVAILRPDSEKIGSEFLAHMLRRSDVKSRLEVIASGGSTRQAITKNELNRFEIPVPSLEQQNRLSSCLSALVTAAEGHRSELEFLKSFRSALLTALLNREIDIPEAYDDQLEAVS